MTASPTSPSKRQACRDRIFPEYNWSPERIALDKADREAFYKRCRTIFERVRPELIENYYNNWFTVIEPNSENYIVDVDLEVASQKARQQHPNTKLLTFRLNATGACGKI